MHETLLKLTPGYTLYIYLRKALSPYKTSLYNHAFLLFLDRNLHISIPHQFTFDMLTIKHPIAFFFKVKNVFLDSFFISRKALYLKIIIQTKTKVDRKMVNLQHFCYGWMIQKGWKIFGEQSSATYPSPRSKYFPLLVWPWISWMSYCFIKIPFLIKIVPQTSLEFEALF